MDEKVKADPNNIREMNLETDLGQVSEIWLTEVKRAHLLICDKFWDSRLSEMIKSSQKAKEKYVYEENGIIKGFITAGINTNEDYILELYVASQFQGQRIGTKLLTKLKENHSKLALHVYKMNFHAIEFYKKNDFKEQERPYNCPHTGFPKLKMIWEKDRKEGSPSS